MDARGFTAGFVDLRLGQGDVSAGHAHHEKVCRISVSFVPYSLFADS